MMPRTTAPPGRLLQFFQTFTLDCLLQSIGNMAIWGLNFLFQPALKQCSHRNLIETGFLQKTCYLPPPFILLFCSTSNC